MAQTTCLALFGLVFVVPAQSITYLVIRAYIYIVEILLVSKKNEGKRKKTHLWPKRCQTRRLGLFSSSPTSLLCIGALSRKNDPPSRVCSEGRSLSCVRVVVVMVVVAERVGM